MDENDNAWVFGIAGASLLVMFLFALSSSWSPWHVVLGLGLLANVAILWLRLQLRRERQRSWTHSVLDPPPPAGSANDRAAAATETLLANLFPDSVELRDMFAHDLARAAEQDGNSEYGELLRRRSILPGGVGSAQAER
jgi:hypothetical protein